MKKMDNPETCVNYALQVRTIAPMSKDHEEALKENMKCDHTRYLPRSINRLRYLGETDGPQQDFDYIEHFRVDNLKFFGRESKFTLQEKTVVRIDGVEHDYLQFHFKILQDKKVVAEQESHELIGTGVWLMPSIFVVLPAGDYSLQLSFVAKEAEILRQPCQSI
jgi:hypothetical protein